MKTKWVNVITETTGNRIWIGNDMGLWTVHKETENWNPLVRRLLIVVFVPFYQLGMEDCI